MRQLMPEPASDGEPDLTALYAYPPGSRPWTRANMVASVDGAAQADGLSGGLSGAADKLFHVLRGLADVVLVGAGTVRREGYRDPAQVPEGLARLREAAGQAPAAAIAVVSAGLELDFDSPLYTAALAAPTITVTVADAPADRLAAARAAGRVLIAGNDRVDLALAVAGLASSWGLRRILCEGGPHLLGSLAAAGLLDELCLTVSPQMHPGSALRILEGRGGPSNLTLDGLLTDEDFLFARYSVKR